MPSVNQTPDSTRHVEKMARRIEDIERRTKRDERPSEFDRSIFSLAGALTTLDSGVDRPQHGGQILAVIVDLGTTGTTDTVVRIYHNDVSIGDVTVPDGEISAKAYLGNVRVAADIDTLKVGVQAAGAGAQDLTVQIRMRG